MRLFIAVDPSPEVSAQVGALLAKADSPKAKWVSPEKVHLTLAFLGETSAEEEERVKAALAKVAAKHRPVSLSFESSGTFGHPPRVLWLGVSGELEPLRAFRAELVAELQVKDEHPEYSPHLTLARAKRPRGDRALAELAEGYRAFRAGPFTVGEAVLYESKGGHYLVRGRFPLGG